MSKKFEKGFIKDRIYDYVPLGFNLSYEDAMKEMKAGNYVSREEWSGFHFIDKAPDGTETYVIVLKDGNILLNPEEVYATDKEDWGIVCAINKSIKMEQGKVVIVEE